MHDTVYGRGAVDMKGAIAAFMIAVKNRLDDSHLMDLSAFY
jgi:acetylornithine deacetylase/succinyl-diaminopimelate desuccinylase-like protein